MMGFGDCLDDLRALSTQLGLDDHVRFTGRVGPKAIAEYLSAADVGLCPDLKTPLNDLSTMNKTMEYMAYALPSVSFDLKETRVSGGETTIYVSSGDIGAFADAVESLLDDPERRAALGRAARERVSTELDWQAQARSYISVYDSVFRVEPDAQRRTRWPLAPRSVADHRPADDAGDAGYVDLEDVAAYQEFLLHRGADDGQVRTGEEGMGSATSR
jgi:Glycosyl transferases group 1